MANKRLVVLGAAVIVAIAAVALLEFRYRVICDRSEIWNGRACVDLVALGTDVSELKEDSLGRRSLALATMERAVANWRAFVVRHRLPPEAQQRFGVRLYSAVKRTARLVSNHRVATRYLCKVRDTQRIDCVSLASLLAFYNDAIDQAALADIWLLHQVVRELDPSKDALIGCGYGSWTKADVDETGADFAHWSQESPQSTNPFSDQTSEAVLARCQQLVQQSRGRLPGSVQGFSGLTGIDPFGGTCDFSPSTQTAAQFADQALAAQEAAMQQCDASPQTSIMDGATASTANTTSPDGNSTTTTTKTSTTVNNADGSTTTTEVETSTTITTNADGSTTTTYFAETSQTTDGYTSVTSQTETHNPDGSVDGKVETRDSDGNSSSQTYNEDNANTRKLNSTTVTDTYVRNEDGSTDDIQIVDYPGGFHQVNNITRGTGIETDRNGHVTHGYNVNVKDCFDEACSTCKNFQAYFQTLFGDCIATGGRSATCQRWSAAANCCSNPNAFQSDPRVVMPNPEGDFVCVTCASGPSKKQRCERLCRVADHEDCYGNCMSRDPDVYTFSLLDNICPYAYSEGCGRSTEIPLPSAIRGGVGPLPVPYIMQRYMRLPLSVLDFRAPSPAMGVGTGQEATRP